MAARDAAGHAGLRPLAAARPVSLARRGRPAGPRSLKARWPDPLTTGAVTKRPMAAQSDAPGQGARVRSKAPPRGSRTETTSGRSLSALPWPAARRLRRPQERRSDPPRANPTAAISEAGRPCPRGRGRSAPRPGLTGAPALPDGSRPGWLDPMRRRSGPDGPTSPAAGLVPTALRNGRREKPRRSPGARAGRDGTPASPGPRREPACRAQADPEPHPRCRAVAEGSALLRSRPG